MTRDDRTPDSDTVAEHARLVALYFKRLTEEGVPLAAAITMAGRYGESLVSRWIFGKEPPREPWEE
jgi:hypothetical protein